MPGVLRRRRSGGSRPPLTLSCTTAGSPLSTGTDGTSWAPTSVPIGAAASGQKLVLMFVSAGFSAALARGFTGCSVSTTLGSPTVSTIVDRDGAINDGIATAVYSCVVDGSLTTIDPTFTTDNTVGRFSLDVVVVNNFRSSTPYYVATGAHLIDAVATQSLAVDLAAGGAAIFFGVRGANSVTNNWDAGATKQSDYQGGGEAHRVSLAIYGPVTNAEAAHSAQVTWASAGIRAMEAISVR